MILIILNFILTVALSLLLSSVLSTKWSVIRKLSIGFVLLFSFNTVIGYLLQLLNIRVQTGIFSILYVLLIGLSTYYLINKKVSFKDLFHWNRVDTTILFGVLLLTMAILVPVARSRNGIINLAVPAGEDMINHFFLVNSINQKGEYIYHDASQNNKMPQGLQNYPQATHFNLAILLGGQYSSNFRVVLTAFKFYFIFSFLLLFILFLFAALDVIKNSSKQPYYLYALTLFFVLIIFTSSVFAASYLHGFISQIMALALIVTLLIVISSKKQIENLHLWILAIVLLNAAIAGSWFFITPIALLVSFLSIYRSSYKYRFVACCLALAVVLPPIYYSISSGSLSSINAAGGIDQIPVEYITIFIIGTIITIWNYIRFRKMELNNMLFLLVTSVGFSFILMCYQIAVSHSLSYYFYKSLYTPVLVLSILFVVALLPTVSVTTKHFEKIHRMYSIVVIIAGVGLVGGALLYHINTQSVSLGIVSKGQYLNTFDFSKLENIASQNNSYSKPIIIKNSGSNVSDYIYSKWIAAMDLNLPFNFETTLVNNTLYLDKQGVAKSNLESVKIINLN